MNYIVYHLGALNKSILVIFDELSIILADYLLPGPATLDVCIETIECIIKKIIYAN